MACKDYPPESFSSRGVNSWKRLFPGKVCADPREMRRYEVVSGLRRKDPVRGSQDAEFLLDDLRPDFWKVEVVEKTIT